MTLIRRAPYNHEVVIADRWRIPYAPAYGWGEYVRGIYKAVVRTDRPYAHDARGLTSPADTRQTEDHQVIKGLVKAKGRRLIALALSTDDIERAKVGPIMVRTREPEPVGVGLVDGPDILIVVSDQAGVIDGVFRAAGANPTDDGGVPSIPGESKST